jgi:RNA recognition motif-containing protein
VDLYVSNIAPTVTEIELRAFFERAVPVAGLKMLPGGDALVTLTDDDAQKALQGLDGMTLAGRAVSIRMALPRRERGNSIRAQGETPKGEVNGGP